jgi:FlaA1/EpsC-like NDP-sugar epimerase
MTNEPRQTATPAQALGPEIDLHRLLGRAPLPIDEAAIVPRVAGKRVLVTGAGGSIGTRLVERLRDWGAEALALVDNHENSLFELQNHLGRDGRLAFHLADVRDYGRLRRLFARHRPQWTFHLAAYKHVPLGEDNADQAFAVNVLGTRNVFEAAAEAAVDTLVYPSTDKAVYPPSVYGATKRVVELLLRAFAAEAAGPRCAVVRLVNAMGAQGGVIRLFARQILEGRPLTLTHEGMSRYWISLDEAALVVAQTACVDARWALLVPDVGPAVRLTTVAQRLQAMLRPGCEPAIRITGMRPGERLAEMLARDDESLERGPFPGLLAVRDRGSARPSLAEMRSAIAALERLGTDGDEEGLRRELFALVRD